MVVLAKSSPYLLFLSFVLVGDKTTMLVSSFEMSGCFKRLKVIGDGTQAKLGIGGIEEEL